MTHSGVQHVVEAGLYAVDLEQAEAFYREVLGLELIVKEAGRHVFFRAGESMLLIFNPDATGQGGDLPSHGARGRGHVALGIPADAINEWRDRLQGHGVEIEREVTWPKGGRSLYFRDPGQNSLELVTPGVWGLPSGW